MPQGIARRDAQRGVTSTRPTPRRRFGPRASLAIASALVTIGVVRFVSDTLYEYDPAYWTPLAHSWLRYLIRAPSDGSVLGDLNAQWFKVLAVPSGISLIYLRARLEAGSPGANEATLSDWVVRGVWIVVFLLGFTVIELRKELVAGEDPAMNHVVHVLGAVAAWVLSGLLTMDDA